jgi:hypothetical protein
VSTNEFRARVQSDARLLRAVAASLFTVACSELIENAGSSLCAIADPTAIFRG